MCIIGQLVFDLLLITTTVDNFFEMFEKSGWVIENVICPIYFCSNVLLIIN